MSTSLPTLEPSQDFLQLLLQEQAELSAVERFSALHDSDSIDAIGISPAEPAQARYYKSLLPATPPGVGQQYSFEVDLDACSGCKACVVACHTLNGLEDDESWRRVGTITIGSPLPQIKHVTTACHHCADPGCLKGCPVKAYEKDPNTGIVRHLDDQCIGCKYCTMMCPYEVPTYNERLGIVRKCDMCHQRLAVGEAPACVQACPNGAIAIRLVEAESPLPMHDERLGPGAPLSSITRPTTRYVGMTLEQHAFAKSQDADIDTPAESHWPLAIMLIATQVSVGVLAVERGLAAIHLLGFGGDLPPKASLATAVVALVVAGAGLAIAPLHLGQPLRAWRVFLGLRTSWLSREAVLFGKYMGLLALATLVLFLEQFPTTLPLVGLVNMPVWAVSVLLTLALGLGVAGLLSSGMIYIATERQLWTKSRTFTRFLGSSAIAGLQGTGSVLLAMTHQSTLAAVLLLAASMLVAAKLRWEWHLLLGPDTAGDSSYDLRSKRLVRERLQVLRRVRIATGLTACSLALVASAACATASVPISLSIGLSAMAACLIGETCERLLYFSSVVYDRMPGAMA